MTFAQWRQDGFDVEFVASELAKVIKPVEGGLQFSGTAIFGEPLILLGTGVEFQVPISEPDRSQIIMDALEAQTGAYLDQLRYYTETMLEFHLRSSQFFSSLEEVVRFLDLPPTCQISSTRSRLKNVRRKKPRKAFVLLRERLAFSKVVRESGALRG
jgi:hypothetical protein